MITEVTEIDTIKYVASYPLLLVVLEAEFTY